VQREGSASLFEEGKGDIFERLEYARGEKEHVEKRERRFVSLTPSGGGRKGGCERRCHRLHHRGGKTRTSCKRKRTRDISSARRETGSFVVAEKDKAPQTEERDIVYPKS